MKRITKSAFFITFLFVLFTSFGQIPTPGLIAYYPFNGNSNDESGNNWMGTVFGASLTNDRYGNENSAYLFDGIDDYIEAAVELPIGNQERSISVWFNTTSASGSNGWNANTVSSWGSSSTNQLSAVAIYKSKLMFGAFGTNSDVYTDSIVNDGNWHHAVVTYENQDLKIFLDTVEVTREVRNLNTANSNLYIGSRVGQSNQFMDGSIDDICIYNRAITVEEIKQLYTALNSTGNKGMESQSNDRFVLYQNWPNPFTFSTSIQYYIGEPGRVQIMIFDCKGSEVFRSSNEFHAPGAHQFEFKPFNLSSGLYYYTLTINDFTTTRKMVYRRAD